MYPVTYKKNFIFSIPLQKTSSRKFTLFWRKKEISKIKFCFEVAKSMIDRGVFRNLRGLFFKGGGRWAPVGTGKSLENKFTGPKGGGAEPQ